MLRMLPSALLLLATLLPAVAQPRTAYHTTLLAHLDPAPGTGQRYSALTGYAAPDGREYALLGAIDGTYVIDVTDTPARVVSFIPGAHSVWREMKTYRTYAYVVTEGRSPDGMQILDLAPLPDSATLIRHDADWLATGHTITQYGDYIHISGGRGDLFPMGGVVSFNVARDPVHPEVTTAFNDWYVHDVTVRNDTIYAASLAGGLTMIHFDPAHLTMEFAGEIRYPGSGTHNSDLTADGAWLFTTDEVYQTPKTLKVWDMRDRGNISKVADYTPVPGQTVHNVHIRGDRAYVSWYTAGTRIIDISNPRQPAQLGYYDTYPGADSALRGNWEVYPYLPSGKILASDMFGGLYVFTFDGVGRGESGGRVVDSATGEPVPFARIELPEIDLAVTADADGRYAFAGAADTLRALVSAPGYEPRADSMMPTPAGAEREYRLQRRTSAVPEEAEREARPQVSLAPNPSDREAWLSVSHRGDAPLRFELFDARGNRVLLAEPRSSGAPLAIRTDALPAGHYFWRLTGASGMLGGGGLTVAH